MLNKSNIPSVKMLLFILISVKRSSTLIVPDFSLSSLLKGFVNKPISSAVNLLCLEEIHKADDRIIHDFTAEFSHIKRWIAFCMFKSGSGITIRAKRDYGYYDSLKILKFTRA